MTVLRYPSIAQSRVIQTAIVGCLSVLVLPGCILIPVPTALPDPEPFTAETLAPIQIGKTTREEVRELFSHWQFETDDGVQIAKIEPLGSPDASSWIFPLNRQVGDIGYVGLIAYGFVVGPVWGGKEDNYEHNWVLVDFNDDDTVVAVRVGQESAPCEVGRVCYRDGRFLEMATEDVAAVARSSVPVGGACSLFIYSDKKLDSLIEVSDGSRDERQLWHDTFLRLEVLPGQGGVSAAVDHLTARVRADDPAKIDLPADCADGEVRYIMLSVRSAQFTATEVPAASAADAVKERMLVERITNVKFATGDPQQPIVSPPPTAYDPASAASYEQLLAIRDPAAWPLLCQAADSGNRHAQMELGYRHRTDLARPDDFIGPLGQDDRLAYVWYRVAELSSDETEGASQHMASHLSDIELAQAQELVRAWRPGLCPMTSFADVKP